MPRSISHLAGSLVLIPLALYLFSFSHEAQAQPTLVDENLTVQLVSNGIVRPTDMAFLGLDDILVLEQYNGTVKRIKDSNVIADPVLDVNVANESERGLLGVEVLHSSMGVPYVFLYYTETKEKDGGTVLGNRLYRYTFADDRDGGKLVNETLLLNLPAVSSLPDDPKPKEHNGGKIAIGPDGNLYLTIGDVYDKTKTQNYFYGGDPRGSGGILRVTPDGEIVGNGILGTSHPLNMYFAYGIRNSFGIDFDPVTGNLWDTENGPIMHDEINLVNPGFNSGWHSVMGFMENRKETEVGLSEKELLTLASLHISNAIRNTIAQNITEANENLRIAREQMEQFYPKLYNFDGKGTYSDPEFEWRIPVAPTGLQFYNSSKLGEHYLNRMFVGEFQTGRINVFSLNSDRTGLILTGPLSDGISQSVRDTDSLLFGEGFDGITDIEVGPDGLMYVLARNSGSLYKIVPVR
jgi:glucose/arabinose dehydrogenase